MDDTSVTLVDKLFIKHLNDKLYNAIITPFKKYNIISYTMRKEGVGGMTSFKVIKSLYSDGKATLDIFCSHELSLQIYERLYGNKKSNTYFYSHRFESYHVACIAKPETIQEITSSNSNVLDTLGCKALYKQSLDPDSISGAFIRLQHANNEPIYNATFYEKLIEPSGLITRSNNKEINIMIHTLYILDEIYSKEIKDWSTFI